MFFKINFLKKIFQENHQNVKQFGPCSGPTSLIWVQTVCQGYQQTTLVGKELKPSHLGFFKEYLKSSSKIKNNHVYTMIHCMCFFVVATMHGPCEDDSSCLEDNSRCVDSMNDEIGKRCHCKPLFEYVLKERTCEQGTYLNITQTCIKYAANFKVVKMIIFK